MTTDALTILRRAAGKKKPFDERQAGWDCTAIVAEYPRRKTLSHKSASPARVMAEWAAEVYHFHTGKFPGRAIPSKRKSSAAGHQEPSAGHYPEFIKALLIAAGVSCSSATVNSACREAGRKLNKRAGLDELGRTIRGQDHPLNFVRAHRNNTRARQLETHVAGEDEAGIHIIDGYEPARDPEWKVTDALSPAILRRLGVAD